MSDTTTYDTDSENEYIRRFSRKPEASVDAFVLQQNRKFDDLIQKNLLVYEKEQKEQEAMTAAAETIIEGKTTDEDMSGIFSRINKVEEYLLSRVVDISVSRFVGNVPPGLQRTLKSVNPSWLFGRWNSLGPQKEKIGTDLSPLKEAYSSEESEENNEEMKLLAEEEKRRIQLFLLSLDDDTKQLMFNQLSSQMDNYVVMPAEEYEKSLKGITGGDRMFIQGSGKSHFLDKFEQVTILSIKIFFVMLKLSIPMAKYFYTKFLSNEYFLLNYDNFNRFIQFMINLLNSLENELLNNEKLAQFQRSMDNLNEQEQRRLFFLQEREQLQRQFEGQSMNAEGDSGILLMPEEANNSTWGSKGKLISSFVTSVNSNGAANNSPSTPSSNDITRFEEIDMLESSTSPATNFDLQDPKYIKYFSPSKRLVNLGYVPEVQVNNYGVSRTSSQSKGLLGSEADDEKYDDKGHISVLDAAEMFAEQL
ncbi:uncharacterized protein KQ657_003598 [Scheffersomyces spartinae]|uniref:Uncharacterized protein n=1 Tax=Scheffersomyces spartinae TaxID=45513 RepID=A0A9P8AFV7_9ASCO|nr:uncharacterized protein KQ657_003598 [Scheffersomyces spartinae]KAG7191285.1 hypothetical protein KQ657_003598 [Scheffersomyces spartinae]